MLILKKSGYVTIFNKLISKSNEVMCCLSLLLSYIFVIYIVFANYHMFCPFRWDQRKKKSPLRMLCCVVDKFKKNSPAYSDFLSYHEHLFYYNFCYILYSNGRISILYEYFLNAVNFYQTSEKLSVL